MAGFQSPWSNNNQSSGSFVSPWGKSNSNTNPAPVQLSPSDINGAIADSSPTPGNGGGGNMFSHIWDSVKSGYHRAEGGLSGFVNGLFGRDSSGNYPTTSDAQSSPWSQLGEGFMHPDQANQTYEKLKQDASPVVSSFVNSGMEGFGLHDPNKTVGKAAGNMLFDAAHDPLSYIPLGGAAKGIAGVVKGAADAAHVTPYVAKAADAVKASPIINNKVVQGTKDAVGKAFVKNYGASSDLSNILREGAGSHALNQYNNLSALKELQKGHGLTPDQLNQIGHITEKTMQGTPEQESLAQSLKSLLEQGAPGSGVGSNVLSRTASAVSGEPLLDPKIENYFAHIYNNVPDELKNVFPRKAEGVGGLSANGTYNLPRSYETLQDAMKAGLKPELNPFLVTGQRLDQMSKAHVNNNIIDQIKKTPGLLFGKDPIDEVSKLVKTGRMTTEDAAKQLGMTVDDLKKGFVQSKIPQLRGAYIRPADEAALTEHLQPARATGAFGAFGKLNNLYNKGFLLNPLPHLHNVGTNGVLLGGAKPEYIKEALDAIKSGQPDPFYQRAIKAGAVNNAVEGKFADAITKQAPTNPLSKLKKAGHDLLWDTDASIRTALFRDATERGMSDAEAAAHTNKFMVDYNNITPFERKYIKPIVPFYAWKKGNIPLQVIQMINQTPKYAAYGHAKDAVSEAVSGQPTDHKGRIMTGESLPDGSQVALDPYNPMDEPGKIAEKGVMPWLLGTLNPFVREAEAQGSSALGAFMPGHGIQTKYPIYNAGAPNGYNARKGIAHAINALNPISSSAVMGEIGNQSNIVNGLFGLPTKDKPGQTPSELITKLFGGFSGRDNPQKDAVNQQYQAKDDAAGQMKYLKETGQPISKSLKKQAYRRVKSTAIK